jgi:uncharacterized protein
MHGRKSELKRLEVLQKTEKSEILIVRGRRRVGKTELLTTLKDKSPPSDILFFMGIDDEPASKTLERFSRAWDNIFGTKLARLRDISWGDIWEAVESSISTRTKPFTIIIDELQWVAKGQSGFLGALKEAWTQLYRNKKTKIILCGSSYRFFHTQLGSESTLRGLRTQADLWIRPFSPREVRKYYLPNWSKDQVLLAHMFCGGIPYYLEQFDLSEPPFRCLNNAFFLQNSIFLDELNEVLKMEFNRQGQKTAFRVLSTLGMAGRNMASLTRQLGTASSTTHDAINKLIDYGLVREEYPFQCPKAPPLYRISDVYLRLYFNVLAPHEFEIRRNVKGFILPKLFDSSESLHIRGFTGIGFEELIRDLLLEQESNTLHSRLQLDDIPFELHHYWDSKCQIDLIADSPTDRMTRVLECKWQKQTSASPELLKLSKKEIPLPQGRTRSDFLVVSMPKSRNQRETKNVIYLDDLL